MVNPSNWRRAARGGFGWPGARDAAQAFAVPTAFWVAHPNVHCKIAQTAVLRVISAWLPSLIWSKNLARRAVADLVAQARQALVAAEHGEYVEDRRRGGP